MSEVIIDEQELNAVSDAVESISKRLNSESSIIKNKDEDICTRYMSYVRMKAFIDFTTVIFKTTKHLLNCGHDINHPLINTEKAKNKGWGDCKIEHNPFFTTNKNSDKNPLDEAIKSLLENLVNKVNTCNEEKKEPTH